MSDLDYARQRWESWQAEAERLRAENERLRAALQDMLITYAPTAQVSGTYGTLAVARAVHALASPKDR